MSFANNKTEYYVGGELLLEAKVDLKREIKFSIHLHD